MRCTMRNNLGRQDRPDNRRHRGHAEAGTPLAASNRDHVK
jgi:hypothetical protein